MNHSRGKGSWWCGLYRHNDRCILHPAHLPHSQALAAFITCKFVNVQIFGHKAAVHLSFQHHNHSLTIIYTPFYSAQSSGVGHILIARLYMVHLMMLSYFTGENWEKERQKRAEGAPPTLWRSCQRAWKSFSPFSSIILHSALSCSARYSSGRVRRLWNPYLTHDTIWMKRKWISLHNVGITVCTPSQYSCSLYERSIQNAQWYV